MPRLVFFHHPTPLLTVALVFELYGIALSIRHLYSIEKKKKGQVEKWLSRFCMGTSMSLRVQIFCATSPSAKANLI